MKNYSKVMMIAVVAILFGVQSANADNKLKDLLGKSSKLGGVVSNVLGSSKVKVSDLQGSWTTTSPAVIFRSDDLLEKAVMKARQLNASYHVGNVLSSDIFYHANSNTTEKWASVGCLGVEMESYALFATAAYLNKKALTLLTVSDSLVSDEQTTAKEREKTFVTMMEIALEIA